MKVPKSWGMFSSLGNLKLRKSAEKFVERVSNAPDHLSKLAAAKKYFSEYQRFADSKFFREAGDTAVREMVWDFALRIIPNQYDALDQLWNEARDENWKKKKEKISAANNG